MKRLLLVLLLGVLVCPGDAMAIRSKWSWYGGPTDAGDNNRPASGIPNTIPGIARYSRATLKGYFVVDDGGKKWLLQQTDIGPSPSTGRGVDINASAVPLFGYRTGNFPTDKMVNLHYLGQNLTQARRRALAMGAKIPGYRHYGGAGGLQTAVSASQGPSKPLGGHWQGIHLAASHGTPTALASYRYGDLSPQAQQLWTPEYRQFFQAQGGEAGFRRRESLRALGRKAPDFHDQSQPMAPPREPTAAFNPLAGPFTPGAPSNPRPIDNGVPPMAGLSELLKQIKLPK